MKLSEDKQLMEELASLPKGRFYNQPGKLRCQKTVRYGSVPYLVLEYLYSNANRWVPMKEVFEWLANQDRGDSWGNHNLRIIQLEKGGLITSRYVRVYIKSVRGEYYPIIRKELRILPNGIFEFERVKSQEQKFIEQYVKRFLDKWPWSIERLPNGKYRVYRGNKYHDFTERELALNYFKLMSGVFPASSYKEQLLEQKLQLLGIEKTKKLGHLTVELTVSEPMYVIKTGTTWIYDSQNLDEVLRVYMDDEQLIYYYARQLKCASCGKSYIIGNYCEMCGLSFTEHLRMVKQDVGYE